MTRRIALLATAVASAGAVCLAPLSASAAPAVDNPDQLLAQYTLLGRDAEKASESAHNTQIEYGKRRAELTQANQAVAAADKKVDSLTASLGRIQDRVDALARASYRGAKVNRLYAVLVSDSPQSVLDQMSGLQQVSAQTSVDLAAYRAESVKAKKARDDAKQAKKAADSALADVDKTRADLQTKQSGLQLRIAQVKAIYESLTGRQLQALQGPANRFDSRLIPRGTSAEATAVQAALSRIGDPYVWGATGPAEFDCSGLMVWAYRQAGKTLPRSSQAQLSGGTEVPRDKLRAGDLIIYYDDASHVGMYVGDGYVVHASTFGVPVKVVPVDKAGPFKSARRY